MSKVIGVLSGKGGVGKTTLVANLGASLTKDFDKNVLILDSNVTTSHLGLHLGLYEDLPFTLSEVLTKKVPAAQAIFIHPTGIRIIPAPISPKKIKFSGLNRVVKKLKKDYELIILDCAPGLGKEVIKAAKCIDQAIIITTPDLPAATSALKTINLLKKLKKKVLGIVLNRVRNEKYELTVNEVSSICNCDVLSIIPEDSKIQESIVTSLPIVLSHKNSPSSIAIKKFASYLVGEEYVPKGFWFNFKNFFRF